MRVLWTAVPALAALVATGLAASRAAADLARAAPGRLRPVARQGDRHARGRERPRPHRLRFPRRQLRRLRAHLPPGDGARERRGRVEDLRHAHRDLRDRRRAELPVPDRFRDGGRGGEEARRRCRAPGDDGFAVRLKQPKPERFTFGDDPLFPSDHMKRLIAAARAGETTFSIKVFDGSDDGHKVYDTLAVIGRRIEPGAEEAIEAPLRIAAMQKLAALAGDAQLFHPRARRADPGLHDHLRALRERRQPGPQARLRRVRAEGRRRPVRAEGDRRRLSALRQGRSRKVAPGFRKRSCPNTEGERDDGSRRRHRALKARPRWTAASPNFSRRRSTAASRFASRTHLRVGEVAAIGLGGVAQVGGADADEAEGGAVAFGPAAAGATRRRAGRQAASAAAPRRCACAAGTARP